MVKPSLKPTPSSARLRGFPRLGIYAPLFCLLACIIINLIMVVWWLLTSDKQPLPVPHNPSHLIHRKRTHSTMNSPRNTINKEPIATVAHVVSLIKCSKSVTGFIDSAAVFRHSIHQQSFEAGKSKYSYHMYAIVHEQCEQHGEILKRLGYRVLHKPPPIRVEEIAEGWYRNHVEGENCCGSAEFIKLYAYELEDYPIVVHWDMDVALLQPMDDLFDAIFYDKSSPQGKAARSRLELQHPGEPLPDKIDAFFTRDVTSAQPWEKVQGVQGGFLIARPSKKDLQTYIDFIKQGNYTRGRGNGSGWNSMGYGGFQGAMAYQGVVAFFYDYYRPNTAVELAVCRWNQVVADVIWRGPARMEHHLQCREYPHDGNFETNTKCEDCRITPIEKVKSAHYTACKKPWECVLPHPRIPRNENQKYRLSHLTNVTTCGMLFSKWFELRRDLERQLQKKGSVEPAVHQGGFNQEYFLGYCERSGKYIPMNPPPDGFDMKEIYGI
mmetsp:Transcript_28822/g.43530  ORF Transcript_28822/g.43530 Transcript_28822/m.43530 type:complete len:495 (-) Transcript_28822:51-1535(-)